MKRSIDCHVSSFLLVPSYSSWSCVAVAVAVVVVATDFPRTGCILCRFYYYYYYSIYFFAIEIYLFCDIFFLYIDLNESLMMQSYAFQPLENQWHRGTQKIGWFPPCDNIGEQSILDEFTNEAEKKLHRLRWKTYAFVLTMFEQTQHQRRKKWNKSDRIFRHFFIAIRRSKCECQCRWMLNSEMPWKMHENLF